MDDYSDEAEYQLSFAKVISSIVIVSSDIYDSRPNLGSRGVKATSSYRDSITDSDEFNLYLYNYM